ncbi:MAG: hypothetical protein WC716_03655 [Chitinophagaceae bacterium]|jgi:hypothetical protein
MKLVFASILFCLLLLPGVGRGQGIVIDENAKRNNSLNFESKYEAGKRYRLENAEIYKKTNVRKIELFQKGYGLRFMLTFDNAGRILKMKNKADNESITIITDTIFETGKTIVVDSFLERTILYRLDTLVIENLDIRERKGKIVRYDKMQSKSYKSGAYLNERNEYYRNLLKQSQARYKLRQFLDHGRYTPPKRIDGNFDPHYRLYLRRRAQPATKPILRRKPYPSEKFYLAQAKTSYLNTSGDTANKTFNHLAKSKIEFFVRGEDFNEGNYWFDFGNSWRCGNRYVSDKSSLLPKYIKKQSTNSRGLIDTIYTLIYYEQAKDKPCVKPPDTQFTDYLRGYSGVPVKSIQYYYSYEYFDE